jgi:hypothetical protein
MNGNESRNDARGAIASATTDGHRSLGVVMAESLYARMQRKGFMRMMVEGMEFDKTNHTTPLYDPRLRLGYSRIARRLNRRFAWHEQRYYASDVARILYKQQTHA